LLKIRSSQKVFTEEEVSSLTGICLEHLRTLAGNRHLGFFIEAAQEAGSQAIEAAQAAGAQALEAAQAAGAQAFEVAQSAGAHAQRLFTASDLFVVATLFPRCEH
jgi:cell division septum initiation protein DivIVA